MRSAVTFLVAGLLAVAAPAIAREKPGGEDRPSQGGAVARGSGGGGSSQGSSATTSSGAASASGRSSDRSSQGSRASSRGSSRDSSRSSARSSARDHQPTGAQLRHPRAGTGHGYRDRDRRYRDGYRYYRPYNRYRYGYGYYGYSGAYWAPYYYGYGYGYPRYSRGYYREAGALRLKVDPEETKVFVDGYYAGVVDDFDGIFQRLYLAPGRHEIALRLEGHRTHVFRVYVPIDQTLKIHHRMVPGEGEDRADFGGEWDDERWNEDREVRGGPAGWARYDERERDERRPVDGWGTLRLDVRPLDASIYVDGEFRGTAREARSLRLPAGAHRIEVVRPGFRTAERDVEVKTDSIADFVWELEKN